MSDGGLSGRLVRPKGVRVAFEVESGVGYIDLLLLLAAMPSNSELDVTDTRMIDRPGVTRLSEQPLPAYYLHKRADNK